MLLSQLSSGNLDALVAVKCLDEGVAIPQVSQGIILAVRQFSPSIYSTSQAELSQQLVAKKKATLIDVFLLGAIVR
ncbi:MAG UNVERIFIED_CONTAM: hypothetical protein LVR29_07960 [Microcystis novacekii LVE1205-3]|jgi:superfamily II DNA or RNA helicase